MRVPLLGTALTLLTSCASIDTAELWTGVHAADQAAIRFAARALTNSPIRDWALYPDDSKPTEVRFTTADGRIYSAKKIRGKWHIEDVTGWLICSSDLPDNGANHCPVRTYLCDD